jgi:hypothetical protein
MLDKTWAGDIAAFGGDIIKGYAVFINEFHTYLDPKRLNEAIAKAFTPNKLLAAGRLYSEQNITTVVEGIGEVLRSKYNYKIRDEKLRLKRK